VDRMKLEVYEYLRKFRRPNLENRPPIRWDPSPDGGGPKPINKGGTAWFGLSSKDYAAKVSDYFRELNKESEELVELGETETRAIPLRFRDRRPDFLIQEFSSLRSEIMNIKDREIESEKFFGPTFIAIHLAYFTGNAPLVVLLFPIVFIVFALYRLREYQRNILEIDSYLREREYEFFEEGAYVNYFFLKRRMESYFGSREVFWFVSLLIAFSIPAFLFYYDLYGYKLSGTWFENYGAFYKAATGVQSYGALPSLVPASE
jgi:hypothetical protein